MSDLVREVEALLRRTEEIWDSQDYGRLKELWDAEDTEPFYLAEEEEEWKIGWPALEKYWTPVPGRRMVEAMRVRYANVRAKYLAADLALAVYDLRFEMKVHGPMKPIASNARVMAVLRRRAEGWRYAAYCEAPISPIRYIQKLYEKDVSDDFADFHRAIMERDKALFEARPPGRGRP